MLKKAALFTTTAVTVALAAGCTGSTDSTPSTAAGGTAATTGSSVPATTTPTSDPGDNGATTTPTSDPGDNGAQIGDAGDGGNWFGAIESCPPGQAEEVQKLAFGDVNGDGIKDALVARTCESITSRWPSTVEVFDGTTPEKPRRIGVLLKDAGPTDFPWITSVGVSGGVVTVKAHGVGKDSPQACANLKLTYRYTFQDAAFTRTGRTATTAADCLPTE